MERKRVKLSIRAFPLLSVPLSLLLSISFEESLPTILTNMRRISVERYLRITNFPYIVGTLPAFLSSYNSSTDNIGIQYGRIVVKRTHHCQTGF